MKIKFVGPVITKFFGHEFPDFGTKLRHKTKGFTMIVGRMFVQGPDNIPYVGLFESWEVGQLGAIARMQVYPPNKGHEILLEDIVRDWTVI